MAPLRRPLPIPGRRPHARESLRPLLDRPLGLILCVTKLDEQGEFLPLGKSETRVVAYLSELPPKKLLSQRLHETTLRARAHFEARGPGSGERD